VGELNAQIYAAKVLVGELFPMLENDDALRHDMIEGSTDLHEAIRHALARVVEVRALSAGIDATINVLEERKRRFTAQEERIRVALQTAMEIAGLPKMETPLGTVSSRAVPSSLLVTNEADIPAQFWKPQPPKLDKVLLKGALSAGEPVPGATLSNGGSTIAIKLT
jgi:hypothetical protein